MTNLPLRQLLPILIGTIGGWIQGTWGAYGQTTWYISAGTSVQSTGTVEWHLQDAGWKQLGQFDAAQSQLTLSGNQTNGVGGSVQPVFYQMTLDKTNGAVQLNSQVQVQDELRFQQGNLNLNGQILDLGQSGWLNQEDENRRILDNLGGGVVQREAVLNAPNLADPGNLGIQLTSPENLGTTLIQRGHDAQSMGGPLGINRYVEISPANNTNLQASLRMNYFDAELNGLTEADFLLFFSQDNGLTWASLATTQHNPTSNYVELAGLSSLARFSVNRLTSFPVQWLGLEGEWVHPSGADPVAQLNWLVEPEAQLRHFVLWRSLGGTVPSWVSVGQIEVDQPDQRQYQILDRSLPGALNSPVWYRVQAVDWDGGQRLSPAIALQLEENRQGAVRVWPNPAQAHTHAYIQLPQEAQQVEISLSDPRGRNMWQQLLPPGQAWTWPLPIGELPSGTYLLQVQSEQGRWHTRVMVP